MPNPINQIINLNGAAGKATGFITCQTNAGFTQNVVVSITDATGKVIASGTFQGKGEKATPTPLLPPNNGLVLNYSGTLPLTLNATFSYNPNGQFTPNNPSKVVLSIPYNHKMVEHISIKSEDSVDNDYNDLILDCITLSQG